MVYCGKPSTACRQCRQRNIKCDKLKDSCGQCVRARITCPGYHDPKSLIFRDQTLTVIQKTRKRKTHGIPVAIATPLEDRAKNMFVSQYVFGTLPMFEYMKNFYPGSLKDVHLTEAVVAVSLAFFSNEVASPSILQAARRKYGLALSLTNKALQKTESATKDTMLLTVILLNLFERLTKNSQNSSLKAELKHIDGALMLIKLRGNKQLQYPVGAQMLQHLGLTVMTLCLQNEVEVPSEIMSLHRFAGQFISSDQRASQFVNGDAKHRLVDILITYVELKAAIRRNELSDDEVIRISRGLDNELLDFCTDLPFAGWNFSTRRISTPSAGVLGDYYCAYPSIRVCADWNRIRVYRILLNELAQEYYQKLISKKRPFDDIQHKIDDCTATILALLAEICASVPQYTDSWLGLHSQTLKENPNLSQHQFCQDRAGAHALIFPMYIAASSLVCQRDMREWIIGRLWHIGEMAAIPQAFVVKEMIERKERDNPWGVFEMLASLSF